VYVKRRGVCNRDLVARLQCDASLYTIVGHFSAAAVIG